MIALVWEGIRTCWFIYPRDPWSSFFVAEGLSFFLLVSVRKIRQHFFTHIAPLILHSITDEVKIQFHTQLYPFEETQFVHGYYPIHLISMHFWLKIKWKQRQHPKQPKLVQLVVQWDEEEVGGEWVVVWGEEEVVGRIHSLNTFKHENWVLQEKLRLPFDLWGNESLFPGKLFESFI